MGLLGFRVSRAELNGDAPEDRPARGPGTGAGHACTCAVAGGRGARRVRDAAPRTWCDLPWALHPVTLRRPQRRVRCRACGIRTERVELCPPEGAPDASARATGRPRWPVDALRATQVLRHAAVGRGPLRRNDGSLSGGTRGTGRGVAPGIGAPTRSQRGKGAALLDRALGPGPWRGDRAWRRTGTEEALTGLLTTGLDARQRTAVEAVCLYVHRPSL